RRVRPLPPPCQCWLHCRRTSPVRGRACVSGLRDGLPRAFRPVVTPGRSLASAVQPDRARTGPIGRFEGPLRGGGSGRCPRGERPILPEVRALGGVRRGGRTPVTRGR